jgi:uncharacterized sporulation protein YeaH/YhbH (DUF444 family)
VRGDRSAPQGGGGGAGRQASDSGEGEDDFVFTLSKEEFMQLFFEDLALPRLLRTHIGETPQYKTRRAGFSHDGTPTTWRGAHHARRPGPAHRAGQAGQPRAAGAAEQLDDLLAQDAAPARRRPSCSSASRRCARAWAVPFSTRSTCAFATARACRCPPARR